MEYGFTSYILPKQGRPFVNELRIGNWISSYMAFMDDKEFSHKEIRNVQVDGKLLKFLIDNPLATYKGIPLSSDILEKCGFQMSIQNYKYEFTDGCYLLWVNDCEFQICYRGIYATAAPGKFVHQLQNLYFSLTGEELTVNP